VIGGDGKLVASWAEMLGNRSIRGEKPLGVPWRLEPLHAPLSLAGGLVGVLRAVIQIPMLPMFHAWQELPLGGSITVQLVRDDDPWSILAPLEQLAEEFLCDLLVPPALHQDIEHLALLIHRPPEVVAFAMNGQKHLIQMPLVA